MRLTLLLAATCTFYSTSYATPPTETSTDAPPVIVDFPTTMRRASATAERSVGPADGPMCTPSLEEQEGATLLGVLIQEPATEIERIEVTTQMTRCFRGQTKDADPFLVLALYRYEEYLGVPDHARGILGAIWCGESALRMRSRQGELIRGDWLDGYPGAFGPFQLHHWAERDPDKCRLTQHGRDDLFASAHCWWSRVEARIESDFVKRHKCKDPYPLAEALVANQGKYGHLGCAASSSHWTELRRWRKKK